MIRVWFLGVSGPALSRLQGRTIGPVSTYRYLGKDCCDTHFVTSDTLAMLDSRCTQACLPKKPHYKVTVVGAASDIGRIVCLFLKQQNIFHILNMYDEGNNNVLGIATDIAHIDTCVAVRAYQGRRMLRFALDDTDMVLVCGGHCVPPPCSNIPDRELFFQNLRYVKMVAYFCAKFCPNAVVAIQTPPVDANFGVFKYIFKRCHVYNKRKMLGVNAVNCMRANQLYARYGGGDPTESAVPVVGGTGRCTRVPVLHGSKLYYCIDDDQKDFIGTVVRECDDLVSRVKGNYEQGHLSIGFATARYVAGVLRGLFDRPTLVDSTLVEQVSPELCYNMKYCSTPITIGPKGIYMIHVPLLGPVEQSLIDHTKCDVEDMVNLGRCHASDKEYELHPDKVPPVYYDPRPCEDCTACE